MASVESTSDDRTTNNTMRHKYRVLNDAEKANMQSVKDAGLAFHDQIAGLGNSREISLAKTKVEEAVMWAVKHITALLFLAIVCSSGLAWAQPTPVPTPATSAQTVTVPASDTNTTVVVPAPAPTVSTPTWLNTLGAVGIAITMALLGWGVATLNKKAGLENNATALEIEAHARDALQKALENLAGRAIVLLGPKINSTIMNIQNPIIRQLAQAAPDLAGDAINFFGLDTNTLAQKLIDKIGVLTASNPNANPSATGNAAAPTPLKAS